MGCLTEMFVEIFIEGVLNLVMYVYLKLAHVFVPDKEISEMTKNKIKNVITTISVLLTLTLFIGVIFLLTDDSRFSAAGKCMTFIPLSIIGGQVVLGIIVTIVRVIKNKSK